MFHGVGIAIPRLEGVDAFLVWWTSGVVLASGSKAQSRLLQQGSLA